MQHVSWISLETVGNECAEHAAALGSLGFVSSHNLATRRVRHSIGTSACFAVFVTVSVKSWKTCVTLELKRHRSLQEREFMC